MTRRSLFRLFAALVAPALATSPLQRAVRRCKVRRLLWSALDLAERPDYAGWVKSGLIVECHEHSGCAVSEAMLRYERCMENVRQAFFRIETSLRS